MEVLGFRAGMVGHMYIICGMTYRIYSSLGFRVQGIS